MISRENSAARPGDVLLPGGQTGFLLIHGLGGTPVELKFLAQALSRQGYTVLCPLMAGHGGTTAELDATTWQDWYRSIESAHDRLLKTCDVVIVGGISIGAVLALRLAASRPQSVHGLALYAPTIRANGWSIPKAFVLFRLVTQNWLAKWFTFSEREPYGIKDERIRRFVLDSLQGDNESLDAIFRRSGLVVLEFMRLVKNVLPMLGTIVQPALIFHPRFDDQSDLSNTHMLQRRLGGLVETVVLEDSYHMVTLDRQRGLVADRSARFAAWLSARMEARDEVASLQKGRSKQGPLTSTSSLS